MSSVTKAERTRERLLRTALELFAEHGYDDTSVAQIAAAAGVSEMTFFRYFPAKESVLLDDPYDPLIAQAVAAAPAELGLLGRAVAGIRAAWAAVPEPESAAVRERVRLVAGSARLRAGMHRNTEVTQRAIADALIASGGPAFESAIAAAAAVAAMNAALLDWASRDEGDLGDAITAALDVLDDHRERRADHG